MKILSMTPARLKDRMDAPSLLAVNPGIALAEVRSLLGTIAERGYNRDEDLAAKLADLLATAEQT